MQTLTPKQARFVQEYLIDLNATQAAIRAGYSSKAANREGARLLANVDIESAVQNAMAARATRTLVSQDLIIRELARIAFSDIRGLLDDEGKMLPVSEWPADLAACVSSLKDGDAGREVKMWDKMSALEKLMKHMGMFETDNTQASAAPSKINVTFVNSGSRARQGE
ncbi:terminase small subunit [Komagataeibacter xylinus]|uniref:terminase small subunit n=1 Tax=Komagataeibacter xylinus TaxID=28448 RepID=UPI0010323BA8|nr:terminase small subunit [Komagataeibacter xylinus]